MTMPRFAYNAKSSSGERISGYRQGVSAGAIAQELSAGGLLPLKIELAEENAAVAAGSKFTLIKPRVDISELVVFSHQMANVKDFPLMVDANMGWNVEQAIEAAPAPEVTKRTSPISLSTNRRAFLRPVSDTCV